MYYKLELDGGIYYAQFSCGCDYCGRSKSKKVNARDFVTTPNWTGFYDIDVEIQYVYDLVEYVENEDGEQEMVLTPKRASDYVVINKPVTFFDENLQTNR